MGKLMIVPSEGCWKLSKYISLTESSQWKLPEGKRNGEEGAFHKAGAQQAHDVVEKLKSNFSSSGWIWITTARVHCFRRWRPTWALYVSWNFYNFIAAERNCNWDEFEIKIKFILITQLWPQIRRLNNKLFLNCSQTMKPQTCLTLIFKFPMIKEVNYGNIKRPASLSMIKGLVYALNS